MKLPNKVVCYEGSLLSKFPLVLRQLEAGEITPVELFNAIKQQLIDVADFVDILDCLFALGKVNFTTDGRLKYVI